MHRSNNGYAAPTGIYPLRRSPTLFSSDFAQARQAQVQDANENAVSLAAQTNANSPTQPTSANVRKQK